MLYRQIPSVINSVSNTHICGHYRPQGIYGSRQLSSVAFNGHELRGDEGSSSINGCVRAERL